MNHHFIRPWVFIMIGFGLGCSSRLITPRNAEKSKIEIDYVLGHSRYKYVASGGAVEAEISNYRDGKPLESKKISPEKYQDFAQRLETAIRTAPTGVVDENCRTPYQITITIDKRISTLSGCRSADTEGKIGKLLKEGEFLMFAEDPSQFKD